MPTFCLAHICACIYTRTFENHPGTRFFRQGGGAHVSGTLTMATSTLMDNRASTEGANLYLDAGSTTTYVLPAPPGYWVPATRCEVWRKACDRGDTACEDAATSCKTNHTDNVDSCNSESSAGSCAPTTFNQPCDWQNSPALLGETVYVLPLGSHDLDYPFACAAGVLGGNGSLTSQQTSAACAGLCPAGFTCGTEATVTPAACPKGRYCPKGTSVVCPRSAESGKTSGTIEDCKCLEGYYDSEPAITKVSCEPCPIGSECKGSGSTLALLPLVPGYWRTDDNSSDLRRCPDASSPDTSACANMNGLLCKPWTTGPYCRVCNVTDGSRYFDADQSACVHCSDTASTRAGISVLAGIILAVLFLFCWCSVRQPCKRLRKLAYRALLETRAPLKQMITFYQVRGSCAICAALVH